MIKMGQTYRKDRQDPAPQKKNKNRKPKKTQLNQSYNVMDSFEYEEGEFEKFNGRRKSK